MQAERLIPPLTTSGARSMVLHRLEGGPWPLLVWSAAVHAVEEVTLSQPVLRSWVGARKSLRSAEKPHEQTKEPAGTRPLLALVAGRGFFFYFRDPAEVDSGMNGEIVAADLQQVNIFIPSEFPGILAEEGQQPHHDAQETAWEGVIVEFLRARL